MGYLSSPPVRAQYDSNGSMILLMGEQYGAINTLKQVIHPAYKYGIKSSIQEPCKHAFDLYLQMAPPSIKEHYTHVVDYVMLTV